MFVFVSTNTKNPDCNLSLCLSHIFGRISLIRDDNVHKRNITSSSVAVNTKIINNKYIQSLTRYFLLTTCNVNSDLKKSAGLWPHTDTSPKTHTHQESLS